MCLAEKQIKDDRSRTVNPAAVTELAISIQALEGLAAIMERQSVCDLLQEARIACGLELPPTDGKYSPNIAGRGAERAAADEAVVVLARTFDGLSSVRDQIFTQYRRSQAGCPPSSDQRSSIDCLSDALGDIAFVLSTLKATSLEEISAKARVLLNYLPESHVELVDQLAASVCRDISAMSRSQASD
jgi:hypothetical protein